MVEIVTVRNRLTLESVGESLTIKGQETIELLATMVELPDEYHDYRWIEKELAHAFANRPENTSRNILITSNICISYIQLLLWREPPTIVVTMRSSSAERIWSDLGFLSRLAMKYGCTNVVISIGSFHVEFST